MATVMGIALEKIEFRDPIISIQIEGKKYWVKRRPGWTDEMYVERCQELLDEMRARKRKRRRPDMEKVKTAWVIEDTVRGDYFLFTIATSPSKAWEKYRDIWDPAFAQVRADEAYKNGHRARRVKLIPW